MNQWKKCKKILCVRADNMGDVIMSGPAIRALKESFQCHVTLLTSSAGGLIVSSMPEIDDVIISDFPWVKNEAAYSSTQCNELIQSLKEKNFDGAIIFTVYSQSALPAAMILFLAGIPRRLAYARENPYALLTNWLPDEEPYKIILHQVVRDLKLVSIIGARIQDNTLRLQITEKATDNMLAKLAGIGVDTGKAWIVLHPGVSEEKRMYPRILWIEIARLLQQHSGIQLILTGSVQDQPLTTSIARELSQVVFNAAGELPIAEFIACIQLSSLVITVNTATVHIAAATQAPQIVLYATTNPQHTPWKSPSSVLYFPVQPGLESRNQVIQYVSQHWKHGAKEYPSPEAVVQTARKMLDTVKG